MITVVTGTDIEKLKGEFESVINGMNMTGKIPYDIYSELFDVGADCIQKAYELGNAELKERILTLEQIKKEHSDYTIKVEEERTLVKDQLTKAKEIIRLMLLYQEGLSSMGELKREAGQFLKEVENE